MPTTVLIPFSIPTNINIWYLTTPAFQPRFGVSMTVERLLFAEQYTNSDIAPSIDSPVVSIITIPKLHKLQFLLMVNVWWAREFFEGRWAWLNPICQRCLMAITSKVVPTELMGGSLYYSFDLECAIVVVGCFPFPVTARWKELTSRFGK